MNVRSFPPYILLVLILLPGDFMTQKSYQLAQKHDPNGARTIGRTSDPALEFRLTVDIGNRRPHETGQMPRGI